MTLNFRILDDLRKTYDHIADICIEMKNAFITWKDYWAISQTIWILTRTLTLSSSGGPKASLFSYFTSLSELL